METGGNTAGDNLMTKDYVKDTQDREEQTARERTQQQKLQLETKTEG